MEKDAGAQRLPAVTACNRVSLPRPASYRLERVQGTFIPHLGSHSEEVGPHPAQANTQDDKELHKVAGHAWLQAGRLQPVVEAVPHAYDAHANQNDVLTRIAKLSIVLQGAPASTGRCCTSTIKAAARACQPERAAETVYSWY